MELLKDLTQILRDIIGFGDEESFRRLEETIRAMDESRRKPVLQSTDNELLFLCSLFFNF
jgi:hypothetical protein